MSVAAPSKAPTILDFVRHGQTPYNAQRECPRTKKMTTMIQGSLDVKLSDLGVKQVETLAETLKGTHYDICYNSTFMRAAQSAEIIKDSFAKAGKVLEKKPDARIRERERGAFAGKLETDFDDASESERLKETETDESLTKRVFEFINEKGPIHPGERLLVVSHDRVISRIILKLTDRKITSIVVANTAVLSLTHADGKTMIRDMSGIKIEYAS